MTSWREVADALAARLVHNEPCSEGHGHRPDDCPYCADAEAMKVYRSRVAAAHQADAYLRPEDPT